MATPDEVVERMLILLSAQAETERAKMEGLKDG